MAGMPRSPTHRPKRIKTYTFEAPAHWASAFVNGDESGLEDRDVAELEAWCKQQGGMPDVIDVSAETFIRRFNGLQTDMATYTAYEKNGVASHRPNRLPPPPTMRKHSVHSPASPAAGPREGALQRVRRLAREHQPQGTRFDPEKRGTWHGSSRDLVVNGHRRGDKHGQELVGDEEGFIVIEKEPNDRNPYILVNPLDYDDWMRTRLWAFQFGAYGWTGLLVWQDAELDDALEEAAGWLADHQPGILTNDQELATLIKEYKEENPEADDEAAYEGATTDLTYTESGHIPSWEWTVFEIHDNDPIYKAALQGSMEEYEATYDDEAPKQRRR